MNSIISGDNMAAATVVDHELGPAFYKDPNWHNDGRAKVLEYGKEDGVQLGGTKMYGKIHAKFWVADDEWGVVSFNADSRSRVLNSEIGANVRNAPANAKKLQDRADELGNDSLEWGTPEWEKLRANPKAKFKHDQEAVFEKLFYLFAPNLRPNI
jgi:phosphatidylserine/phosphatidylglycerophosphate/cardiolipin synthase-like enzyme